MEQFAQRLGLEAPQGQDALRRAPDVFVREVHQLEQAEREIRGAALHRFPGPLREGKQFVKTGGALPSVFVLRQNQGEDGCQFGGLATLLSLALPNAHHVGKQAQAHERGFTALVFPQNVEECIGTADFGGEKEVGFGAFHPGVDKGAGKQGEGVPIDVGRERGIEVVPQKASGVLRIGKRGAKEFVVRLVQGFVRHGDAHPTEETAATQ